MDRRKKLWIKLIAGIFLLLFMLWIPEFAVLAFVGMLILYIGKKLWYIPIGTVRRKR